MDDVLLEAKGVAFKGGTGYLVRCTPPRSWGAPVPPVAALPSMFAPNADALKFLIRHAHCHSCSAPIATLMPPGYAGHSREREHGCRSVNLGVAYSHFELGAADSFEERALNDSGCGTREAAERCTFGQ